MAPPAAAAVLAAVSESAWARKGRRVRNVARKCEERMDVI
jgi:hypothetical protein